MIVIVDHGLGNLTGICMLLSEQQLPYQISSEPEVIKAADVLVLHATNPFAEVMWQLSALNLISLLKSIVSKGKPLLGIQVGMQLLLTSSDQNGYHMGLNIIPGHTYFQPEGISSAAFLKFQQPHALFFDIDEGEIEFDRRFQPVLENKDEILAAISLDNSDISAAIIGRRNVFGINFSPEFSIKLGQQIFSKLLKTSNYLENKSFEAYHSFF